METVNTIAAAAAQAVWPNNKTGVAHLENNSNTSYDSNTSSMNSNNLNGTGAGTQTAPTTANRFDSSAEPLSGVLGDTSKGEPYDAGNKEEQDAANARFSGSQPRDEGVAGLGRADKVDKVDTSRDAAVDTTETADTASANPAGTSAAAGAAGMKDSKVPSTTGTEEPNLDGPDPRPIQQVAKEHSEGTGEKYIRSTGLLADGGDFDAAREGAGREADRILEEKGISFSEGQPSAAANTSTTNTTNTASTSHQHGDSHGSNGSEKKKKSLGEKIKNKIRRSS